MVSSNTLQAFRITSFGLRVLESRHIYVKDLFACWVQSSAIHKVRVLANLANIDFVYMHCHEAIVLQNVKAASDSSGAGG